PGPGPPSAVPARRPPRPPSPTRDGVSGRRLYLPGDVLVERLPAELDRVGSGEAVRRGIVPRQAEPRAVRVDPSPDVSPARRAGAARHAQHPRSPGRRLAARSARTAAHEPGGGETPPQSQVEEAKYYLGPARAPAARFVDRESGELPRAYGCDRILLLLRDPWWAFTYWEITPATRVHALRALGAEAEGARELLRVYDVTFITFTGDNAWQSFDVELPPGADHWYLNVGRPAASFCVETGLATPGGRFLPLARSNVVTTPRATPSPDA